MKNLIFILLTWMPLQAMSQNDDIKGDSLSLDSFIISLLLLFIIALLLNKKDNKAKSFSINDLDEAVKKVIKDLPQVGDGARMLHSDDGEETLLVLKKIKKEKPPAPKNTTSPLIFIMFFSILIIVAFILYSLLNIQNEIDTKI